MNAKPRIAWFAPLELGRQYCPTSISAYLTSELLPLLSREFDFELFHDRFDSHPAFPTFHALTAYQRHREHPFDLFVYNVEDVPQADFTKICCGTEPGLVYVHTPLMRRTRPDQLHQSPWQHILGQLTGTNREWPARNVWPEHPGPWAHRECAMAFVTAFPSLWATQEFRHNAAPSIGHILETRNPSAYFLPYPAGQALAATTTTAHEALGVGFLGGAWTEHRPHKLLEALSTLTCDYTLHWLIDPNEEPRARELCAEFEISKVQLHFGRSPANWRALLPKIDIAVHTYFTVYDMPSPYAEISMMHGAAVVVNDFAESSYYPSDLVLRITPGESEALELAELLRIFAATGGDSQLFRAQRQRAQLWADEFHSSRHIAQEWSAALNDSINFVSAVRPRWLEFTSRARGAVLAESLSAVSASISQLPNYESALHSSLNQCLRDLGWQADN